MANFKIQPDKTPLPKFVPKSKEDLIVNQAIQRMLKADDPDLWQSKQAEFDETGVYVKTSYKGFYIEVRLDPETSKAIAIGAIQHNGEIIQFSTGFMDSTREAMSWLTKIIDNFRKTKPNIGKQNGIILIN